MAQPIFFKNLSFFVFCFDKLSSTPALIFRLDDVEVERTDDALDDVAWRNVGVAHLEFVAQQLAPEVPTLTSWLLLVWENSINLNKGNTTDVYESN